MLGREDLVVIMKLSQVMAAKRAELLFASAGVGERSNRNPGHEVLLKNDPWRSTTQSPVGKGSGLGSVIGNRVVRLNCLPD